jgi:hypothetical protein
MKMLRIKLSQLIIFRCYNQSKTKYRFCLIESEEKADISFFYLVQPL